MLQDALSELVKVHPPTKLKVLVFLEGRNKELSDIAEKVQRAWRTEVEEKGLKLSITEGGKEGLKQAIAVLQLSGREVSGLQQKKVVLWIWPE